MKLTLPEWSEITPDSLIIADEGEFLSYEVDAFINNKRVDDCCKAVTGINGYAVSICKPLSIDVETRKLSTYTKFGNVTIEKKA